MGDKLFPEFRSSTKEEWKEVAISDLKGGDFEKKLVWKTVEGFDIQPFYTSQDLEHLSYLKNFQNGFAWEGTPEDCIRTWINKEKIVVESEAEANMIAADALHRGATGLLFDVTKRKNPDLGSLLREIHLHLNSVSFLTDDSALNLVKKLQDYAVSQKVEFEGVNGALIFDPISKYVVTGVISDSVYEELKQIIDITDRAENLYGLTVTSSNYHNSGATIVQEIALTLSAAVEYIDKLTSLGLDAGKVIRNVAFSIAVGSNFFMEIAKLRALRNLFSKIANSYGLNDYKPSDVQIHSISSLWTKTIFDPHVNMLRNTTEAMAAILGGCNELTVEPFDATFRTPNSFSRRIATNVSNILKEESYLDQVVDPGAGSYYIENLTDSLMEHSWKLLNEIEIKGGFIEAFKQGFIPEIVNKAKASKTDRIAGRRDILVGTNQYPNTTETLDPDKISVALHIAEPKQGLLTPQSGVAAFEEIRIATEKFAKKSGKRPKIYLALIGQSLVMKKARAAFSTGFFGCGGFAISPENHFSSVDEAVSASVKDEAELVVICGADEDYALMAEEFAEKFKSQAKGKTLVLAGYPKEILEKLQATGVDIFIHLQANAVQVLKDVQKRLNII